MNTKTKVPAWAGFFAGLLIGIGTVIGAAEYDRTIERDFQASTGGKLIVQADRGSIEANTGTWDNVHVRVLRHVKGGSQAQADELFDNHEVTFKQDGNTLFAGSGTKTLLLLGLAARECDVPAGYTNALPAVLIVGTTCTSVWLFASMTPSAGAFGWFRAAR